MGEKTFAEVGVQTLPVEVIPIGGIGAPPGLESLLRDEKLEQTALQQLETRLGRPARGTPEEVLRRSEDKHRRAQMVRDAQDEQRMEHVGKRDSRILAAKARRQQREQEKEIEFEEKMKKANAQHQEQLRIVSQRARNENRKSAEVAYITKEMFKHEKEVLKRKQEKARMLRLWRREEMKKRLIQGAARLARVAENRRKQLDVWQSKVQEQLEEKDRLAMVRRLEQQETLRLKSQERETRSEMARGKRIELQEEDDSLGRDLVHIRKNQLDRHVSVDGLSEGAKEEVVKQLQGAAETQAQVSPAAQRNRHSKSSTMPSRTRLNSPRMNNRYPDTLRRHLAEASISDEEALKVASEVCGSEASVPSSGSGASTGSRSRMVKHTEDLKRVLSFLDDSPCGAGSFDPERADQILADFCKVLGQLHTDAEVAAVLQLGCADVAFEIVARIRKLLIVHSSASNRGQGEMHTAQSLSNVMLSVLKCLGLLTKQTLARMFLLLTGRVVALVDIAVTCLDWQLDIDVAARTPEAQGTSRLCLPQVLHMLALHLSQNNLPARQAYLHKMLASYVLLSGMPEKLCDLFKEAEMRGMRIFEGGSLMPLLLLRAMSFLRALTEAYRVRGPAEAVSGKDTSVAEAEVGAKAEGRMLASRVSCQVVTTVRDTELFGIVSILGSVLLADGGRRDREIPQTVLSLSLESMKILNAIACIDLAVLQETLNNGGHYEFYHVMVCLLDYCGPRAPSGVAVRPDKLQDESTELLHETVTLLGYYCLGHAANQGIMWKLGEGQTLLARITSLPMHYFLQESSRIKLFPTILATCFRCSMNRELLGNEMDFSYLQRFLDGHIKAQQAGKQLQDKSPQSFARRFPPALWQEALEFFSEDLSDAGEGA